MKLSEANRLLEYRKNKANWKQWGPYLSDRAWGTVREDYGGANPWDSFPFDQAHKRVFRWGEDGIGGICDRYQCICFAFAFWNGKDPILKERFFGLSNSEGNHGEDVKELYYHLDATPTSTYLKMLYKYPQTEFPYEHLRAESRKRGLKDPEYELCDTGIFKENRYFDILIEYVKLDVEDMLCRVTVANRGPEAANLTLLPTIWFRNTWKWGYGNGPTGDDGPKPKLYEQNGSIVLEHPRIGSYHFYVNDSSELLFCENDSDISYSKDAFHRVVIHGDKGAVNPKKEGTKAAALFTLSVQPQESRVITCRLSKKSQSRPFHNADENFAAAMKAADQFYQIIQAPKLSEELKTIQRRAFAGLLFSKQFYYIDQLQWESGDPNYPPIRGETRNQGWDHLTTFDLISVPDKWEFPYLCSWDMGFHCISMVLIDPDFAKRQLTLLTREWYMHPSGKFPSYEWGFSDVNPPVHAWALWRVYKIDAKKYKKADRAFLEGIFHKLLLNFTWWVNKKDAEGNNVFQGGFLGMDNISIFNRSTKLPLGGHIDQSDATAWMSFFCIMMLKISLHLSEIEPVYQDAATKFFEHFLRISYAMTHFEENGEVHSLWNEEDGFFYDLLHLPNQVVHVKVRSLVGLIPLLGVETLDPDRLEKMPDFARRMNWFAEKRPEFSHGLACMYTGGMRNRRLLSMVTRDKLIQILKYMLDEKEFLSPYGIRSVSKYHEEHPYVFRADGQEYQVKYVPADSDNRMFGGNSNWRGPIWFPINFLLIEALQRFYHYYGDELKVECPTGSGIYLNLWEVATEISGRLMKLFLADESGKRPIFGNEAFHEDLLFHEYFDGDTGKGLGASHQTGWTSLIAKLIQQSGEKF